jgi:glucose/arabinose dehydrogenase
MSGPGRWRLKLCFSIAAILGLMQTICPAFRSDAARRFDLNHRIFWTSSHVVGSPDPPPLYEAEAVFTKLKLHEPLCLTPEPGSDRFFLVERYGNIRVFQDTAGVEKADILFTLPGREVYSLVFHPDYAKNGFLFVFSNLTNSKPQRNVVSRFHVTHDPILACRVDSEIEIISWESSNGHDGGCMAFGPDGYLYISAGDGSAGSDTRDTGQYLGDLLSSLLRIDVNHSMDGRTYSIPADNPFIKLPGA